MPPEALAKMHKMHELLKVDRVQGKRGMGFWEMTCFGFKHHSAILNVSNLSELSILACCVEVLSKSRLCMDIPMPMSMMSASRSCAECLNAAVQAEGNLFNILEDTSEATIAASSAVCK